jgi:hypothetical protein
MINYAPICEKMLLRQKKGPETRGLFELVTEIQRLAEV